MNPRPLQRPTTAPSWAPGPRQRAVAVALALGCVWLVVRRVDPPGLLDEAVALTVQGALSASVAVPEAAPVQPTVPAAPVPPVPLDVAAQATWERLFAAELEAVAAPEWASVPSVPDHDVPRLRSRAWYVVDVATGEVLTAKEADVPRPIASLTKLASGLVWVDSGADPEAALEMTQEDKDFLQVTRSRLRVGASYRAWDLFHSSLLSSDNRATVALARQTGLPMEALTAAMERRAAALGLATARFGDPTGLDPRDVASPRDVARLLFAADAHPVVGPVLREVEHRYRRVDRSVWLAARSSNRLKHMKHWDVGASKTGYTDLAGSCVAFRARIAGRDLIVTLLGARGVDSRYGDAARLRAWIEARSPAGPGPTGALPAEVAVVPDEGPSEDAPSDEAPSDEAPSDPDRDDDTLLIGDRIGG